MSHLHLTRPGRSQLAFCLAFGACALVLAAGLELGEAQVGDRYLRGMAQVAGALLRVVGVPAIVQNGPDGIGVIAMPRAMFHVTHECTGLHALALFVAAILAWPAAVSQRLRGLAWGVPAFFAYSAVRLVVLGLVAHHAPSWTGFLHIYLLVLVNAGFLLCLWALWVNGLPASAAASEPEPR